MEIIQHKDCPYFPCSFEGQSCKHCACCMYPCKIEDVGGKWIKIKSGNEIWDCSACTIIHRQDFVEYLNLNRNEHDDIVLNGAKAKLRYWLTLKKLDDD